MQRRPVTLSPRLGLIVDLQASRIHSFQTSDLAMCLEQWALVKHARGQEWTKPFLLQITAEGGEPELTLTFRTLGGNVAASIKWNSTDPITGLPETVLSGIRNLGFECPFEPVRVSNLRLIKPDGAMLDVSPDAPRLAEQMATQSAQ